MSKFIDINTSPFTKKQLRFFRKEIEEAGSTDELMIQKQALKKQNSCREITTYKDIEEYKEKFLIGVYEPLREHYNTKVPYIFWGKLYEFLKKVNPKVQC